MVACQKYPAVNPNTPPLEWVNSAAFIWASPGYKVSNPTLRRQSAAKTYFTTHHTDMWPYFDEDKQRKYWNSNQGIPMPEKLVERFLMDPYLYKMIDNVWKCIYQPDSAAGHQFMLGNLTVRELRDSIEW